MAPETVLKQTVLKCSFHNNIAVGDAIKDKDTKQKTEASTSNEAC